MTLHQTLTRTFGSGQLVSRCVKSSSSLFPSKRCLPNSKSFLPAISPTRELWCLKSAHDSRRKTENCFSNARLFSIVEMDREDYPLEAYDVPEWAAHIPKIPKYRIKLAMPNTPIHRWNLPGLPKDFDVFIKRDDMTGSTLSGNKIRKLELLLADAKSQGCDTVITCGGVRSNHCRTTAVAARQLGMDCHLIFRADSAELKGSFTGNTLMDRLVGCHFYLIPKTSTFVKDIQPRMDQLVKYLGDLGKKAYPIPIGGSNSIGLFGYMNCFKELIDQGVQERFTDIVITCGSSGSVGGLAVANYLTGSKLKIHGMAICDDSSYFHGEINRAIKQIGLEGVRSEDIVEIVEGVKGLGYGLSQPEELKCMDEVAMTTGIFVDPVYTGKATYHLIRVLKEDPGRFQGNKILFVHTGGVFDVFSGKMESLVDAESAATNKVHDWMKMTDRPPIIQ